MKAFFRKIFGFVLTPFEKGEEPVVHRPSNRPILIAVGILFSALSCGLLAFSNRGNLDAAILPIIVFFCVGAVCLIVGLLGTDRAVASIWGSFSTGKKR
jgi:hypothetical protein